MLARLRSKWGTFWYNFGWSDWVGYIDGWIPRFAFFVPIVGYLILFNDRVGGSVAFHGLLSESMRESFLTSQDRLRLVYFGMIFLGISNLLYRWKRPYPFRFGSNRIEVTRVCLETFTFQDFLRLHQTNRSEGHLTTDGKYYDSEWDGFREAALNEGEGTANVRRTGNWEQAKQQYGSLLRSLLSEYFFRFDISRRAWLVACIVLSTIGFAFLSVPSVDLFIKVVVSTFSRVGAGAA